MIAAGSLVECIDDRFTFPGCDIGQIAFPKRGHVYTVNDLHVVPGKAGAFLRLVEIINPEFPTRIGLYEPSFSAAAFRPADPARLAVFRAILAKSDLWEGQQ